MCMYMLKQYFVYLKYNNKKTGDCINTTTSKEAEIYFANKKKISVSDWLEIYYVKWKSN